MRNESTTLKAEKDFPATTKKRLVEDIEALPNESSGQSPLNERELSGSGVRYPFAVATYSLLE